MSEQNNRCIALVPAGHLYTRLFDEVFAPAITRAHLIPYRIEQTAAAPLQLGALTGEIAKAEALFADLSQGSTDIWFAVGAALIFGKPLCLVSSRSEFSQFFDIHDLEILTYASVPLPSDYTELEYRITDRLLFLRPRTDSTHSFEAQSSGEEPFAGRPAEPAAIPPTIEPYSNTPSPDDLTAHEVLALTIIDLKSSEYGLSPRDLGLEMKNSDSASLTSHAMNSLRRRKFIERRPVEVRDANESYITENLFITRLGESWLLLNGKRKRAAQASPEPQELFLSGY